jgi:hypothetical protein
MRVDDAAGNSFPNPYTLYLAGNTRAHLIFDLQMSSYH